MSLSIQGQLIDNGTPIEDPQEMRFTLLHIADIQNPATHTLVWPDTVPVNGETIDPVNGIFVDDLPIDPTRATGPSLDDLTTAANQPLYLKIEIWNTVTSQWDEFGLSPITSVPFALHAGTVADGAIGSAQIADGSVVDSKLDPLTVDRIDDNKNQVESLNNRVNLLEDNSGSGGGGGPQVTQALVGGVDYGDIADLDRPVALPRSSSDILPPGKYLISIPISSTPALFPFSLEVYGQTSISGVSLPSRLSVLDQSLGYMQFNSDPTLPDPDVPPSSIFGSYDFNVVVSNASGNLSHPSASSQFTLIVVPEGMGYVPPGSFFMGDLYAESTDGDESPIREITISRGFFAGQYEVTQGEWVSVRSAAIEGNSVYAGDSVWSSLFDPGSSNPNRPLSTYPWQQIILWLNAKSLVEGLEPVYTDADGLVFNPSSTTSGYLVFMNENNNGYRLPTEAEWEYMARGGSKSGRFPWGNDLPNIYNHFISFLGNSKGSPVDVGSNPSRFLPNAYGLYHLGDNLSEYVWDIYESNFYGSASRSMTDPDGPDTSTESGSARDRVYRGGNYTTSTLLDTRVSDRNFTSSEFSFISTVGFRYVRFVEAK